MSETGETGVTDREQISKMLDDKLKWILKKDLAKDLMTIVETFLMIIQRLELPKVEVELDDILQKIQKVGNDRVLAKKCRKFQIWASFWVLGPKLGFWAPDSHFGPEIRALAPNW